MQDNTTPSQADVQRLHLTELSEQMASRVAQASADDLPLLSRLHADFEAFTGHLALGDPKPTWADAGRELSVRGKSILEQIVLHETDDAVGALRQVSEAIVGLQRLLNGEAPLPAANPAPAPTATQPAAAPTSPAAPAPAVAEAAPAAINPEDLALLVEFVTEAQGHLDSAEAALLRLGDNPDDLEAVNAVFRAFHTLKGVAGLLNLKAIGALAHVAENMLDLARKGELELTGANIDLVLEARDAMKGLLTEVEKAAAVGQLPPAEAGLDDLVARLTAAAHPDAAAAQAAPPPAGTPVAEPAASQPAAPAPVPASTSAAAAAAIAPDTDRRTADRRTEQRRTGPPAPAADAAADATVKVSTEKLDRLINMVGELMIAQSMVRQDLVARAGADQKSARNSALLGKITRDLQDLAMSMRMVPVQGVFQKMARLVRDLTRRAGKQIDLVTEGAQTELDRNVVEAISDPLVHMVRNSVDHGIETPDRRVAHGKERTGRISLRACHLAGNVVISITDDGQGLNTERILAKAQQAGIVRKGQELSEQEVFSLIFHPGLSTAEQITDISGRGVGMDVVKKNVEALRGRIDIASTPGKGACFTVRLPLTLAVIDGLVVRVGTGRYIVPLTSIEQSIRPKPGQISTIHGRGELCAMRDGLLPVIRLHRLFNLTPASEDPAQGILVVVHDGRHRACLLVDELLGQQEVVIKALGEGAATARGVSGGAILGDGSISIILDVPGLIQTADPS